jgi:hypothetical protein
MNLGARLMLCIACIACIACIGRVAHAEAPQLEVQVALGLRNSSTTESHQHYVVDETSSVRVAADGLLGFRFGRFLVGLRAGLATPLRFYSSSFNSGEIEADTESAISPLDLGLAGQFDILGGLWFSGWLGTTVAFAHANSPAKFINAIDFFGPIPDASWRYHTTNFGWGVALGYDVVQNKHGRLAAVAGVEFQGIGTIPYRYNTGAISAESETFSSSSVTLGVAYAF